MCLAAGLCQDPLGELERSPRPSHNQGMGPISKGKGEGSEGNGGEGKGRGLHPLF